MFYSYICNVNKERETHGKNCNIIMTNSLEKVLENGFIIKRISTKHAKSFYYNKIERPVTPAELFRFLDFSNKKLSYYDLSSLFTGNSFVKTFVETIPNESPILEITSSAAFLKNIYQHGEYISIPLDRASVITLFSFLEDNSLYNTDFEKDFFFDEKHFYQGKICPKL